MVPTTRSLSVAYSAAPARPGRADSTHAGVDPSPCDGPSPDGEALHDSVDCARLALDHLWLADAMARRFRGRGEDDDDLLQVARCALLEAAHRYDPGQGPFVPFAGPTITGVLKRHFRDHGWVVRPPRRTQQLAVRITQQWPEIAQERGAVPDDTDLAACLGESIDAVREARQAAQGYRTVPIETATAPIRATAVEDPAFDHCEARLLVAGLWKLLDEDERELVRLRFWERRSQADIATRLGTSQMQVSRLLSRLLERLRDALGEDGPVQVRRSA